MEFKDRLKEARKQMDMTQQQVAEQIGITKSTYCGYETGKREPDVAKIKQLSRILHVTGSYLIGLDEVGEHNSIKKSPRYSSEAMEIAMEFDSLDNHGRRSIQALMDEELNRMEELENLAEMEPENEPKIINLFDNPSAAGLALDDTGQGCQPYELKDNDPQGASYAVRVQGDSMEPYFQDGSIVFINHDQMRDGDIGIFCVDGATVIKQWHYDRMLGITYLFSLNRKRADADVVITRNSGRSCVWQGRVMTRKRFDLPGM